VGHSLFDRTEVVRYMPTTVSSSRRAHSADVPPQGSLRCFSPSHKGCEGACRHGALVDEQCVVMAVNGECSVATMGILFYSAFGSGVVLDASCVAGWWRRSACHRWKPGHLAELVRGMQHRRRGESPEGWQGPCRPTQSLAFGIGYEGHRCYDGVMSWRRSNS
jgi:hypothetical protein